LKKEGSNVRAATNWRASGMAKKDVQEYDSRERESALDFVAKQNYGRSSIKNVRYAKSVLVRATYRSGFPISNNVPIRKAGVLT
jgi:hypothetical protein